MVYNLKRGSFCEATSAFIDRVVGYPSRFSSLRIIYCWEEIQQGPLACMLKKIITD